MKIHISLIVVTYIFSNFAFAHSITVDGAVSDWLSSSPALENTLSISQGELTWRDASNDERTDLDSPDPNADLGLFGVTADATNLYFRSEFGSLTPTIAGQEIMLQIAIDTTLDGSGQTSFWGLPETSVANSASWEYIALARPVASSFLIDDTFTTSPIGSVAFAGNTIELSVPWSALGVTPGSGPVRITTSVFRTSSSDTSANAIEVIGSSDALDAITDISGNTWNEVSDGVIDFSIDVQFLANGDVSAVPVPPAVWLFGSGLLGLVGMARRKKVA